MQHRRRLLAAVSLSLAAALSFGFRAEPTTKISVVAPHVARSGGKLTAKIRFDVPDGFHIYAPSFKGTGIPVSFELVGAPKGMKLLHAIAPKGETLAGRVVMKLPIWVPAGLHGKRRFSIVVHYQQCNDRICLPPANETVSFVANVR